MSKYLQKQLFKREGAGESSQLSHGEVESILPYRRSSCQLC